MEATRAWLDRWGPMLPILVSELIILLGFGALLPVLPLYVVEHGIDVPTLGLIAAAWSIAKLVAEPVFGYLADRTSRKPFLIGGAIVLGIATMLPVVFTSAAAMFVLRFIAGAAAGAYDPAARGVIVDSTPEGERGEAFGIYAAFQMGGFVLGPVIGAFGAALGGGYTFPFLLTGALSILAAVVLALTLPSDVDAHLAKPTDPVTTPDGLTAGTIPAADVGLAAGTTPAGTTPAAATTPAAGTTPAADAPTAPTSLLNRSLVAAVVIHFGFSLAFGTYEVVWSLFLESLGASIAWVGLTFMIFGISMMVVAPWAGRLVDRYGPFRFAAVGGVLICLSGVAYAVSTEPVFPTLVTPVEGAAEALLMPALYALVAFGSPSGRSSTAQGIFGAVGTIGLIVATIVAAVLWESGRGWPFVFFALGGGTCLALGLGILLLDRRAPVAAPGAAPGGAAPT